MSCAEGVGIVWRSPPSEQRRREEKRSFQRRVKIIEPAEGSLHVY